MQEALPDTTQLNCVVKSTLSYGYADTAERTCLVASCDPGRWANMVELADQSIHASKSEHFLLVPQSEQ
ncbi:hypothetical protein D9M71_456500 [compost metagenome]